MITSFSANSQPGNAAVAATPHPSALRAATFPSRGRPWLVLQITIFRSNDTERAVRPQGIGIIMIASGNHTIIQ